MTFYIGEIAELKIFLRSDVEKQAARGVIGYEGDKIMDELKRLNNNQYDYLRQLPIGKLLELLDIAPVPASYPEDEAYVDALEEAIIEKENENPTGFFPDVDQQWNEFVTYYMPSANNGSSSSPIICPTWRTPRLNLSAQSTPFPHKSASSPSLSPKSVLFGSNGYGARP